MSFTKLGKKFLGFLALLTCILCLASCNLSFNTNPNEQDSPEAVATNEVNSVLNKIVFDDSQRKEITANLKLVQANAAYPNVTITWSSSDSTIINEQGEVNRPFVTDSRCETVFGVKVARVELTVTASRDYVDDDLQAKTVSDSKKFSFTVKAMSFDIYGTIAEVKAFAAENIYVTNKVKTTVNGSDTTVFAGTYGVVSAFNGTVAFMISDGEAGIYVYKAPEDLQVGDLVQVQGNVYSYYGNLQFGSEVSYKKVAEGEKLINLNTDAEMPFTPTLKFVEKDIDTYTKEFAAIQDGEPSNKMGSIGGNTYTVYGKLVQEVNSVTSDYYHVASLDGTEIAIYSKGEIAEIQPFNNTYVNISIVTYDRYSTNKQFRCFYAGHIEAAEAPVLSDAEQVAAVKKTLAKLTKEYIAGSKLTLPTTQDGATVAWALSDETTLVNGKFALVETKTVLTATATITVGTETDTCVVTLTVNPLVEYTVKQAIALEAGSTVKLVGTVEAKSSSAKTWYFKDSTGTILVYATLPTGVTTENGSVVTLIGTTGVFNGTPQINSISSMEVASAVWEQSAPTETTIESILAYTSTTAPFGEYLQVTGKLVKSGNYYYLADLTDATKKISLYNSVVTAEKLTACADTDTKVTLFVYFYGNAKADYSGDFRVVFAGRDGEYFVGDEEIVKPVTRTYKTVAEAKATTKGDTVTVRGVITKLTGYSSQYKNFTFLIQDATGGLLVYRASDATGDFYATLKVGQEVELTGIMDLYSGLFELTKVTSDTTKIVSEGNKVPAAVELEVTSNLEALQGSLVTLKDAVVKSTSVSALKNGTVTLEKNGLTYTFFVNVDWPVTDALLTKLQAVKAGDVATISGYMNWHNGAQVSPCTDDDFTYETVELTDQQKADQALAEIKVPASATADVTLTSNAGVVWTFVSGTAATLNNDVLVVTRGTEDSDVVIHVVVTIGTATAEKDFTITVLKKTDAPVGATEYTYDFVTNYDTYAAAWTSSYVAHTVSSTDLGADLYACTFDFTGANKQAATQTIHDRPVIAGPKSANTQYMTVSIASGSIAEISFEFQQWGTKTFVRMFLEVTTDGTTWTQVGVDGAFADGKLIMSATGLEGVIGARVGFEATARVQVGVTSCTMKVNA
jgi:uncharacterized protein YdeI (BOF family)